MLNLMQVTCDKLVEEFGTLAQEKECFDVREVIGKVCCSDNYSQNRLIIFIFQYITDIIASCAFGIDAGTFSKKKEKSKFMQYADGLADFGYKFAIGTLPGGVSLLKLLNIPAMKQTETEFFDKVVKTTLEHRKKGQVVRRNDMIDLMIDAMKGEDEDQDFIESDQFDKDAKLTERFVKSTQLDEIKIIATSIVFLFAGLDTISALLGYACYELANNQEVQEKLRKEIDEKSTYNSNEKFSYDDLHGMTYLDQVICETLRFHNIAGMIQRVATRDYNLPGTDLIIPKGMMVRINAVSVHFNPKHYHDANHFNPDHFCKEAKSKRHP